MRKFLLVGQSGVGKSSFINAVFGNYVAKTSKYEPCTQTTQLYEYKTLSGNIMLIDTPGLAEDSNILDRQYLQEISENISKHSIDVLLYISTLTDNRFRPQEKRTLYLLIDVLGTQLWERSWLALTFASKVPLQKLNTTIHIRRSQIESYLREIHSQRNIRFIGFKECLVIDNVTSNWLPREYQKLKIWHKINSWKAMNIVKLPIS